MPGDNHTFVIDDVCHRMGHSEERRLLGHRFVQDKSGDWWWSVIKRKGKNLSNVHKVRYQYGDQSGNTVTIKPEGRDEGSARWARPPSEVKFEVPTEYRIVVRRFDTTEEPSETIRVTLDGVAEDGSYIVLTDDRRPHDVGVRVSRGVVSRVPLAAS